MPDISMCNNEQCPIKKKCYRYTAKPNEIVQTYANFKHDLKKGCDHFIPNKTRP